MSSYHREMSVNHRELIRGLPLLPVIPPNVQAVWLNPQSNSLQVLEPFDSTADDSSSNMPVSSCDNHERCLESDTNDGLADTPETVRNTSIGFLSSDVQAVSLNGDTAISPASSSEVSRPTFLNLLEDPFIALHIHTVFLDKFTVMELSSLAAVSRRLREGAIATMQNRSLNIRFVLQPRYDKVLLYTEDCDPINVPVMLIDDISDRLRSTSIEFCNSNSVEHNSRDWSKLQKLLAFCGIARVKRIDLNFDECFHPSETVLYPNQFAMKSNHTSHSKCSFEEFFVDELTANCSECFKLLELVSPRVLKLNTGTFDAESDLDAVMNTRGILSVESIFIQSKLFSQCTDEQMPKLSARRIHFIAVGISFYDYIESWTPVGVSEFIEQWVRGHRVIEQVFYTLGMTDYDNETIPPAVKFGRTLVEHLEKLDQPPQIAVSTTFDDQVFSRVQNILGAEYYYGGVGLCAEVSIVSVTAGDGRKLTISLSRAKRNDTDEPLNTGFIYIFPSN